MRFGPVRQYLFVEGFHITSKHWMSVYGVESGEKKERSLDYELESTDCRLFLEGPAREGTYWQTCSRSMSRCFLPQSQRSITLNQSFTAKTHLIHLTCYK